MTTLITKLLVVAPKLLAVVLGLGLFSLGGQGGYNWAQTAKSEQVIILNDWYRSDKAAIQASSPTTRVFVYKDLTSTRADDCGSNPGGGTPCIQNGVVCPTGVNDAPYYAAGLPFCWTWRHHRNWFLRGTDGQLLTESGFQTQYVMDYGNRRYDRTWARFVIRDARRNGWHYVFGDNVLDNNGYGIPAKYPTAAATQRAMARMLRVIGPRLRRHHITFVGNLGYTNVYQQLWKTWMPYVGGFQDQHAVGNLSYEQQVCAQMSKLCLYNQQGNSIQVQL